MNFKQGDTFDYTGPAVVNDAAGDPVDLTGWAVASHVLFPDSNKTVELTATWVGTSVRLVCSDTEDWPLGAADIDVEFTSPSDEVVSTETVRFQIVKDITNGS